MKPPDPNWDNDPEPRDSMSFSCSNEDDLTLVYVGAGFPSLRILTVGIDFGTTYSSPSHSLGGFIVGSTYSALSYTWGDQEKHDWAAKAPRTTTTMTEPQYEGFVLEKAKPLANEGCSWARVGHRKCAFSHRSDLSRHMPRHHQVHLCQECESECHNTFDFPQDSVDAYLEPTFQAHWSFDSLMTGDHDPGDEGNAFDLPTWTDQDCRYCSCPQL